jgi:hypothetical protein
MLILHWNGSVWKRVASPSLPKHTDGFLYGVTATSARNVWAVGAMTACGCGPGAALIVHWNGSAWRRRRVSIKNTGYDLHGVAAVSARTAWAVGTTGAGDSPTKAQISRFNGGLWKPARTPSPGAKRKLFDSLAGLAATSARDAWAVGSTADTTLVEHWNGSAWKRVPSTITFPSPPPGIRPPAHKDSLYGVAATSDRAPGRWGPSSCSGPRTTCP